MIHLPSKPLHRYSRVCKKCGKVFEIWKYKRPVGKLSCSNCVAKSKEESIKKLHKYVLKKKKERLLLKNNKNKKANI